MPSRSILNTVLENLPPLWGNHPTPRAQPVRGELWGVDGSDEGFFYFPPKRNKADGYKRGARKRAANATERAGEDAQKAEEMEAARVIEMRTTISEILDSLAKNGVRFSEVLNYVFDANNTTPQWRWDEVFSDPMCIRQALDFCASKSNPATGRRSLTTWATNYILSVVDDEATEITKSGILRANGREVNASFALGLDFGSLAGLMRQYFPTIMKILARIATTERQEKSGNADLMLRKDFVLPGNRSVYSTTSARVGTKHHDDLDVGDTGDSIEAPTSLEDDTASNEVSGPVGKPTRKPPPLSIDDILINGEEQKRLRKHLIHTVLRVAVHHGGPGLRILHKEVYDTMNIEEASTAGNEEVIEAITKELDLDTSQASNKGGASALQWAVFVPGLFHYKIATHGIMAAHLGLINLTIRTQHCSSTPIPPHYPHTTLLFDHAEKLADKYTNIRAVAKLRRARQKGGPKCGDTVYENAILFMRDALLLREGGPAPQNVGAELSWQRTNKIRTRYAVSAPQYHTCLAEIPADYYISDMVLKNWLVNPTGHPNSFIEVDLLQEHLNFWIKDYYQAHGIGASWERLATVYILRQLETSISGALGSKQGNHHSAPDLTEDIDELMGSFSHHNVYKKELGRAFDDGDLPTADVVEAGFVALSWGMNSALNEYNNDFKTLQQRRRVKPLVPTRNQTNPDHSGTQQQSCVTFDEDISDSDSDSDGEGAEDAQSSLVDDLQTGTKPALDLVTADDVALDMDGYDDRGGIDSDNEWDGEEEGDI
ncbi:hypothetical protein BV22DRAFT_1049687 [Leucogyrophana mollusca]|uniref:Uncharacterized protein n=1 Tax=Leucogyrophana mollusca TaxID=85980 RepID=A0ACB8B828_9AGAM|nr:hypothetical protein BV22DRAFT_1049687 [Leucogyrophana mollusca]